MRATIWLAFTLCACGATTPRRAASPRRSAEPERLTDDSARWPSLCADLKAVLDPEAAKLRARRLAPPSGPADAWRLRVDGLTLSLPSRPDYTLRVARSPSSVSATLTSRRLTLLISREPPPKPLTDVFAKVGGDDGDRWSARLTRRIFGEAPTPYDLLRVGYAHSPGDLTCAADRLEQEVPIGVGLVLKGVGAWAAEVYRDPFGRPGFLYLGPRGAACAVEAQLHDERASYLVTHLVTGAGGLSRCKRRLARMRFADAPAASRPGATGPRWLGLLGEALSGGGGDRGRWEALRALLGREGRAAPAGGLASVTALLAELRR